MSLIELSESVRRIIAKYVLDDDSKTINSLLQISLMMIYSDGYNEKI